MEEQCKAKTGEGVRCSRAAKYNGYCLQHKKLKTSPVKKVSPVKKSPVKISLSPSKKSPVKLRLPEDMLREVFSNMDFDTAIGMCQSDKRWLQLCNDNPHLLANMLVREGVPVNRKGILPSSVSEWVKYDKTNKKAMKFVELWNPKDRYKFNKNITMGTLIDVFPKNKTIRKVRKEFNKLDDIFGRFNYDGNVIVFNPFSATHPNRVTIVFSKNEFINGLAKLYAKYPKFEMQKG